MRKAIFIFCLFTGSYLGVNAQVKDTIGLNVPIKDEKIVYEGIVNIQGKSKADLLKNATQWFVDYFNNSNDVIQNKDNEDGLIVGKGIINFNARAGLGTTANYHDKLSIKIQCKDNKYKYTVYDMLIYPPNFNETFAYSIDNYREKLLGQYKMPVPTGQVRSVIKGNDAQVMNLINSMLVAMAIEKETF